MRARGSAAEDTSGQQRTVPLTPKEHCFRMARLPGGFPRRPDPQVLFAVRYEDGRTAYIRVDPETAWHGNLVVMDVARERQEAGEIPRARSRALSRSANANPLRSHQRASVREHQNHKKRSGRYRPRDAIGKRMGNSTARKRPPKRAKSTRH